MQTLAKPLFFYSAFIALLLSVSAFINTNQDKQFFQLAFLPVAAFFLYHIAKTLFKKTKDASIYPEIKLNKSSSIFYLVFFFTLAGYGLGGAILTPKLLNPAGDLKIAPTALNLEDALSPHQLTNSAKPPAKAEMMVKITAHYINVREKPTLDSAVVGTASEGEVYRVLDTDRADGWYKIELDNGRQGWVDYNYIEKVED